MSRRSVQTFPFHISNHLSFQFQKLWWQNYQKKLWTILHLSHMKFHDFCQTFFFKCWSKEFIGALVRRYKLHQPNTKEIVVIFTAVISNKHTFSKMIIKYTFTSNQPRFQQEVHVTYPIEYTLSVVSSSGWEGSIALTLSFLHISVR